MYMRVELAVEARKALEDLPRPIHARMLKVLERLQNWPEVSGAKALRGDLAGHFRMRTGDYRLQFFVEGDAVVVEKIGHRDGFYEE
jgi:mRNA-degrading endonuclease RelE of RelBE toxin-antitoxin system